MTTLELVLGILLFVGAIFLVVAVLMQNGKDKNLSGAIAGGAETFFGKTKGRAIDKILSRATSVVAIIFVLIVIAMYAIQPDINWNASYEAGIAGAENYSGVIAETTAAAVEEEVPAETAAAETEAPAETVATETVAAETVAAETVAAETVAE